VPTLPKRSPSPTPDKKAPAAETKTVKKTKPSLAETADPYFKETKKERDARMGWWRDARFGMFIHWGVYSNPAGFYEGKSVPVAQAINNSPFALIWKLGSLSTSAKSPSAQWRNSPIVPRRVTCNSPCLTQWG
jgi:hypothetical protein